MPWQSSRKRKKNICIVTLASIFVDIQKHAIESVDLSIVPSAVFFQTRRRSF